MFAGIARVASFDGAQWTRAIALLLLVAAPIQGQPRADPSHESSWIAALDRYLTGDYAGATASVDVLIAGGGEAAASGAVARIVEDISRAPAGSREHASSVRRLQGAVLVPLECLLPLSARVADDPRFAPLQRVLEHAIAALDHVVVKADPRLAEFRLWSRIGLMQHQLNTGQLAELEQVAKALRIPDGDHAARAEFALLRGMARERTARLVTSVYGGSHTYLSTLDMYGPLGPVGNWAPKGVFSSDRAVAARRYFRGAADWYKQALEVVPSHAEARLHLGRTLIDLKRPQDAVGVLGELTREPCGTPDCPVARLFIGAAHEALGDPDAALTAYSHASRHAATRQSALAALLHLELEQGRPDRTLPLSRQLQEPVPASGQDEPDAWGIYVGGRRADSAAVLRPMRERVLP